MRRARENVGRVSGVRPAWFIDEIPSAETAIADTIAEIADASPESSSAVACTAQSVQYSIERWVG